MAWDSHKLALDVVEEFATAQSALTHERLNVELGRIAVLEDRRRERAREYARTVRGGLKGYTYNDGRWRGTRPATRYVQLELTFPVRVNMREKLPRDRVGVTQKFTIITRQLNGDGQATVEEVDIYLTVNCYPHNYKNEARRGQLGEVFIRMGKVGHTEGIFDEWAKAVSRGLQHNVPVDDQFRQHVATRFPPFGMTTNKEFPSCTSILDLVSRWILSRFGSAEAKQWIASMEREELQP